MTRVLFVRHHGAGLIRLFTYPIRHIPTLYSQSFSVPPEGPNLPGVHRRHYEGQSLALIDDFGCLGTPCLGDTHFGNQGQAKLEPLRADRWYILYCRRQVRPTRLPPAKLS